MAASPDAVGVAEKPNHPKKSVIVAYLLWLFGGIFGIHHYYLGRDRHGFVWWSTLGGFGVGWIGEVLKIHKYVLDANEDPKFMSELISKMRRYPKPPFSMNRFIGILMVSYSWAQMTLYAIPPDGVFGINLRYLYLLVPLAVALGVWNVGNIGRECGELKWALIAAYASYPIRYYIYDESVWIMGMVISSALVFDSFAKKWDRRPRTRQNGARRNRRDTIKRVAVIGMCTCLYLSLWGSYLYYQGTITDSNGDEIPIYEAINHFYTSRWWLDLKQALLETYNYAQHHGWYEVWKQIVDLSDPHGEQNAYKVLGVGPDSSQQEITATWRSLVREYHPDKVKDEALRRQAKERFLEIQNAYELLSNSKSRRSRKNKKDNTPVDF